MNDFGARAIAGGGIADVRGCLILSRDGLVLGGYPDDETGVKPSWFRFASLGEPERGFVQFGDQVWFYVRRPAYGAFAVANAGVRPGLVIDQIERLLAAEESRNRRDTLRGPRPPVDPRPAAVVDPSVREREFHVDAPGSGQRGGTPWSRTTPPAADGASADPAKEELAKVASGVGRSGDATPADGPTSDPKAKADEDAGGDAKPAKSPMARMRTTTRIRRRPRRGRSSGGGPATTQRQGCGRARSDGARRGRRGGPVLLAKEFSRLLQDEA